MKFYPYTDIFTNIIESNKMKKAALVSIFFGMSFLLNAQEGYSCSCGGKYDSKYFKEQIERADFVFVGQYRRNLHSGGI